MEFKYREPSSLLIFAIAYFLGYIWFHHKGYSIMSLTRWIFVNGALNVQLNAAVIDVGYFNST